MVETTNLTDKVPIGSNGAGYAGDPGLSQSGASSGRAFHADGRRHAHYEATVDDPQTWTKPWTLLIALTRGAEPHLYEYACHEGNYAMPNILSGARADQANKK